MDVYNVSNTGEVDMTTADSSACSLSGSAIGLCGGRGGRGHVCTWGSVGGRGHVCTWGSVGGRGHVCTWGSVGGRGHVCTWELCGGEGACVYMGVVWGGGI